jgi:hypothetical protein
MSVCPLAVMITGYFSDTRQRTSQSGATILTTFNGGRHKHEGTVTGGEGGRGVEAAKFAYAP